MDLQEKKAGRFPIDGAPSAGSSRLVIFSPTRGTHEALNLVLDVLAQLLEHTNGEPHSLKYVFGKITLPS